MIFKKTIAYSRVGCLEAAGQARAKGKVKKAIAEYRKVLDVDPADQEALTRIAPLLAEAGDFSTSWQSFQASAERYLDLGFFNKAAGVYAQAARCMPRQAFIWEKLSELYLAGGRKADAVGTLVKGHLYFRGKKDRIRAIKMLKKAFEIEPWGFEPTYALAGILKKSGQKDEALALLEGLASKEEGAKKKMALKAAFWVKPSAGSAWRWLRAAAGK